MRLLAFPLTLVLLATISVAPATAAPPAARFDALVTRYFDLRFANEPTWATAMGRHEHDAELEDYSLAGAKAYAVKLGDCKRQFLAIPQRGLTQVQKADRALILGTIDSQVTSLLVQRSLENDPDDYSSGVTAAAFGLIARDFAAPAVRAKALIARMKLMPAALAEGKHNLAHPPHVYTEVALEQISGNRDVFATTIPTFAATLDAPTRAAVEAASKDVVKALDDYGAFVQKEVLPRSNGTFALGAAAYRKKWHDDEMVDVPLERLQTIGEADLAKNQAAFRAAAARIDPSKSAAQVLATMGHTHPPADKLMETAQATLDGIRAFLVSHHIVTIPAAGVLRVVPTPPFMRATTSAAMDAQGPFETRATDSFFFVTPPDPSWTADQREAFMAQFTPQELSNLGVHEAYPGHYLQYLNMPKLPSITRKLLGASTLVEGWAHYCEQMVLDEGFHDNDPGYRLAQLQDALLRDARLVVGIKLHTQGMTVDQAQAYFEREAYQDAETAKSEARRGTSDPLYGYYTLGKLMIFKLREDYKKARGAKFNLQEFHDAVLHQGQIPMPLMRQALLGAVGDPYPADPRPQSHH